MDTNQANDELQKAIEDITKNSNANQGGGVDLGVPPTPPVDFGAMMPPEGGTGTSNQAEPLPTEKTESAGAEMPVIEPTMGESMNGGVATGEIASAVLPDMPPVEPKAEPLMTVQPEVGSEAALDTDLEKVKEEMMMDLLPLMDKIKVMPEQKFKIYKQAISLTHDKKMIKGAYEAVKEIGDETMKAEALLYLIEQTEN